MKNKNVQYPTRNIQSRRKEIKPKAVVFRVSDAIVWRIRHTIEGKH